MTKKLSLRKLKKLDGYHGRLFILDELADEWIGRMAMKLGSEYVSGKRLHKEGGVNLVLAYFHKE